MSAKMNTVLSCFIIVAILVNGGQASKYCPGDPEYFKEEDSSRYYCGDICIDPTNSMCLKAKGNSCCPKSSYPNVTKLEMDNAFFRTELNQSRAVNEEITREKKYLKKECDKLNATSKATADVFQTYKPLPYVVGVICLLLIASVVGNVILYRKWKTPVSQTEVGDRVQNGDGRAHHQQQEENGEPLIPLGTAAQGGNEAENNA